MAQRQIERQRRLAPAAELSRSADEPMMCTRLRFTVILLVAIFGCGPKSNYTPPEDPDRKHERRLQPAIAYVDGFLAEHGRLPNSDEFRAWSDQHGGMYTLRDHTHRYAASKGAKEPTDYMAGTWRADWYHYYKSWDRGYVNGGDEDFWEHTRQMENK